MTRPDLTPESAQLLTTKIEELNDKFVDFTGKVTTTLDRRLQALDIFHTREGISADPERLRAVADKLFESVDTLIFLAEDYRALAKRIQESQPIAAEVSETHESHDGYYSKDELDLFAIFQTSDDSAVSAVWILSRGFGLSTSEDYTARKKLLQKTIASLHDKLSRTEPPMEIIKTGQTRGTKYQLAELALGAPYQQVVEPTPASEPVIMEQKPEPQEVVAVVPVPVAVTESIRYVTQNEGLITAEIETSLSVAIQYLIDDDTKRPIICVGDITLKAFGSGRIDERKYQLVKQIIDQDHRLTQVNKNEYQIIGREDITDWIDKEEIEANVDAFIDEMTRKGFSQESYGRFIRIIGQGRRFLTSLERIEMMNSLRAHPQYAAFEDGFIKIDVSKSGKSGGFAPVQRTREHASRGLTNSELNARLTELSISGRKQPARRYNPSTKRRGSR